MKFNRISVGYIPYIDYLNTARSLYTIQTIVWRDGIQFVQDKRLTDWLKTFELAARVSARIENCGVTLRQYNANFFARSIKAHQISPGRSPGYDDVIAQTEHNGSL